MDADANPPARVVCYVDGFNLYHGMMEHTKCRPYRWLNLWGLAEDLLLPGHALRRVVFFTSVPPWNGPKAHRHRTYLAALESVGVEIVEGRFQQDSQLCRATCKQLYRYYVEKLTDVNISAAILSDGVTNRFDWAYLLSGDADQAPTVSALRALEPRARVRVIFPPRRASTQLQQISDDCFGEIGFRKLKANQLPETIAVGNRTIQKPDRWR